MKSLLTAWIVLSLFSLTAAARAEDPKPPAKPESSGLEVVVKSIKIDVVALKKVGAEVLGADDFHSKDKVIIITLQITNKGQKDVDYKTFNGAPGGKNDYGSLIDSKRKYATLADFGDMEPVGITRAATLKPGDTITDVMVFGRPIDGARPVTLLLPRKNHGEIGRWQIDIKPDALPAE